MIDLNHSQNLTVRLRAGRFHVLFLVPVLVAALGSVLACQVTAQTFKTLYNFTGSITNSSGVHTNSDGANPVAGLILAGKTLYGTASQGGGLGNGTVFAINTDGTGFTNLHRFTALYNKSGGFYTNSDGAYPLAGLALVGDTLYGVARYGGSSGSGTVFRVNTNGTLFKTLYNFSTLQYANVNGSERYTNNDGAQPQAHLILSGNTLYGETSQGGSSGVGTVFGVNTDGTGFTNLCDLRNDSPDLIAGLVLSGNTLYTASSGFEDIGIILAVNTYGTGLTSFGVPTGLGQFSGLVLSGSTLYGTAERGPPSFKGNVFKVNTNGSEFAVLHSFEGFDGAFPGGVVLSHDTLYGNTRGQDSGSGSLFAVNTDGTGFKTLHAFIGSDGADPSGGLLVLANTLYGTTSSGGISGNGTVFSLTLPPQTQFTFTTNNGTITITGYTGTNGAVFIPDTINGLPVTSIGTVFQYYSNITSVKIGTNVSSIEAFAFEQCFSLTSITIPDSVTKIGRYAFAACVSLTSVIIPNSVAGIGDYAFFECSTLINVTIGNSVTNIGTGAFSGSGLKSVTIPSSVANIGGGDVVNNGAFQNCYHLTSVYCQGNAPRADSTVFASDPATVYYFPGTTGWGPNFAGLSTAPWTLPYPLILDGNNSSPSFGVHTNQFGFTVSWATNLSVVVEASTDLNPPVWTPLTTNALSGGSFYFTDPQWTNYPRRFYRVRSQ